MEGHASPGWPPFPGIYQTGSLQDKQHISQACPHWPLTHDQVSLTSQDPAGDPRDSLYLCDIVVHKILITGGVQGLGVTERPPQFGCDGFVVYFHDLSADVVPFRNERSVSQDANAAKKAHRSVTAHCQRGPNVREQVTYGKTGGSTAVLMTPA